MINQPKVHPDLSRGCPDNDRESTSATVFNLGVQDRSTRIEILPIRVILSIGPGNPHEELTSIETVRILGAFDRVIVSLDLNGTYDLNIFSRRETTIRVSPR